jgi:aryl-alcohol dehydrogenase-like predicted oxidoreductase
MIAKIPFGKSGHLSTRTVFGAAAFYQVTQAQADQTIELLLKYGINHIDTAASYGDSEIHLGPWIDKYRSQFFLASKTGERSYKQAKESIQRSLERLRTDHLDLIQLHAVVEDSEWEAATGPGGALEAAVAAREEGLVRFIGITSHSLHAPAIHLKSLERFDFDSVLLPYNYMLMQNPAYAADFEKLFDVCSRRNVAVQLIKTLQRRPWQGEAHFASTWYEPFSSPEAIDLAVRYGLGRAGTFLSTPGDVNLLPKVLEAASRFEIPPEEAEMKQMVHNQAATPLWE